MNTLTTDVSISALGNRLRSAASAWAAAHAPGLCRHVAPRARAPLFSKSPRSGKNVDPNDHEDWPLVFAYQAGDRRAGDALVRKHEGIIRLVAKRYYGVDEDDLLQEARMGFLHGIQKCEQGKGGNPVTYSIFWARHAATRYMEDHKSDVRVPNGHQHSEKREDLANSTKLVHQKSIHDLVFPDSETTLLDVLVDQAPAADIALDDAQRERFAIDLLAVLDPKKRDIVSKRFGIGDGEEMTLKEIGIDYGVTRERIRQIEIKAMRMLRDEANTRDAER